MAPKTSKLPIELDGRTLEGGGQLIRIAVCLSALTDIPIKINHIRGNRSGGGGLKAQHLACVNWLAYACNAQVEGAEKGSKTLVFTPRQIEGDLSPAFKKRNLATGDQVYECTLEIGTAGSTGLALQAILPYILFTKLPSPCPVHLKISGGTNVSGSPSYEYITHVLLPTLSRIGFPEIKATLGKRGWSHGGSSIGNYTLIIPPRESVVLPSFKHHPHTIPARKKPIKPSSLKAIFIAPSSCFGHFREVLLPAIDHQFGDFSEGNGNLEIICEGSHHEKRLYLVLIAKFSISDGVRPDYILAQDWLYDRKIRTHERSATEMVERVAKKLADEWLSGAWADEHMRDQLIIFQALAHGRSEVYPGREYIEDEDGDDDKDDEDEDDEDDEEEGEVREPSLHTRTAEWVTKQMLRVKFDVEGRCEGVGFDAGESEGVFQGLGTLSVEARR